jgi:hypothetical protein
MPPTPTPQDWDALRGRAQKFATAPRTVAAIHAALDDPDQIRAAMKDPVGFFAGHGVKLPGGLDIELSDRELRTLPGPDWLPFVLEFFNCRTYWVLTCDDQAPPLCRWKEESVCFGIRIYPKVISPVG